jgi:Ca-activated chloride channel family protein
LPPFGRQVYAGEPDTFWRHAERAAFDAYRGGDFEGAIANSKNPLLLGASYYRRGQYRQALEQFGNDDSLASTFNRGNTLLRLQRYSEALQAYRQVLLRDPGHERARYNLRLLEIYLRQQAAAAEAGPRDSEGADNGGSRAEAPESPDMRIGIAVDSNGNPADRQQVGPGIGAGGQSGQVDPMERFDGSDSEQGRFVLRAHGPGEAPQTEFIERWISGLPETSRELYRRKFLRDFHRQQRQPQ